MRLLYQFFTKLPQISHNTYKKRNIKSIIKTHSTYTFYDRNMHVKNLLFHFGGCEPLRQVDKNSRSFKSLYFKRMHGSQRWINRVQHF